MLNGIISICLEVGVINIFIIGCLIIAFFKVQATSKFIIRWNSLTLRTKSQLPKWKK